MEIRLNRNDAVLSAYQCFNTQAKNGIMDLSAFAGCVAFFPWSKESEGAPTATAIEAHFKRIDKRGNGAITWADLVVALCTDYPSEYVPRVIVKLLEKEWRKLDVKKRGWISRRQFDAMFRTPDWSEIQAEEDGASAGGDADWELLQEKRGQPVEKVSQNEFMLAGYAAFAKLEYAERTEVDDELDSMMGSYMMAIPDSDLAVRSQRSLSQPPPSPKTPQTPRFEPGESKRIVRDTDVSMEQPIKPANEKVKSDVTEMVASLKPIVEALTSVAASQHPHHQPQQPGQQQQGETKGAAADNSAAEGKPASAPAVQQSGSKTAPPQVTEEGVSSENAHEDTNSGVSVCNCVIL